MAGRTRGRGRGWLARAGCGAALILLLAGCGVEALPPAADLVWPQREIVFRVLDEPPRLEAYALRGGIALLGSVRLPAGVCPQRMAFDAARERVWLWSAEAGVAIDARALRIVERWQAGAAPAGESVTAGGQDVVPPVACAASARLARAASG